MNERSLKKKETSAIMARNVDENKLISIENAAKELVIANGYGGASISAIAKKAGVAVGYLYRFYNSKQEFVEKLLFSRFEVLINNIHDSYKNESSIKDCILYILNSIIEIAETKPIDIQFLYVLINSYNFKASKEQVDKIFQLTNKLIEKGKKDNEIKPKIRTEEFFNILVTYPIVFFNQRFKGNLGKTGWDKSDLERLKEFCQETLLK